MFCPNFSYDSWDLTLKWKIGTLWRGVPIRLRAEVFSLEF